MGIMLLFMRRLDVYLCGSVHVYLCGIVDVYLCGNVDVYLCGIVHVYICGCTNLWVYPLTNHLWMCGCSRCSGRPIIYRHFPFNRLHIVKAFDPNITAQWNCFLFLIISIILITISIATGIIDSEYVRLFFYHKSTPVQISPSL